MKIVFINSRKGIRRTVTINSWVKVLVSICVLCLPVTAGLFFGVQLAGGKVGLLLEHSVEVLQEELTEQRQVLSQTREQAQEKIQALTLKLAELQTRLVRLDALGERLTVMSKLDDGEFDFSTLMAVGGPQILGFPTIAASNDLQQLFDKLEGHIESREQQLGILDSMLRERQLLESSLPADGPIIKGWVSSAYGYRSDPFNGQKSWHNGVDFIGDKNAEVQAVATGVVTWSGDSKGYGNLVEIDHGHGLVTRYGHNKINKVTVGSLVEKGQVIATVGSTGRATGPHLHFEVYKNGRSVDPSAYINRTLR